MSLADPLRLLWRHLGEPIPADVPWRYDLVRCARCGEETDRSAWLTDVISDKFTGWDAYATGTKVQHWCVACAWGHTEPILRHYPWLVTPAHAERATPSTLLNVLASPLDAETAVIVPLSRKKHLLPSARWGLVTTDDVHLPWNTDDVSRLAVLNRMRALGFSEATLFAPAPRFEHLRTLSTIDQSAVLSTWPELDSWRAYPPRMHVALRATRKDAP